MWGEGVDVFYDDGVEGSICRGVVAGTGFGTFIKLSFFVVVMVVVGVVVE